MGAAVGERQAEEQGVHAEDVLEALHDGDRASFADQCDLALEGFGKGALGGFAENTSDAEGVKLRVLGAGTQIFEPTAAAMHYLAESTGKHYPGQTYTQVFTHGDVIRSMAAGLTLGSSVRAGLEDNLYLPDGQMARSNGDLIAKARQMVEDVGRKPASVQEARTLLGVRRQDAT